MSEASTHHARIVWRGNRDDLRARDHPGRADGCRLLLGAMGRRSGEGDPEEMFVASIAACHMLWFLDFARRGRLRVASYEDDPIGTMDGTRFSEVLLQPRVTFKQDVAAGLITRLHDQAHKACFIANSVRCEVRVELTS